MSAEPVEWLVLSQMIQLIGARLKRVAETEPVYDESYVCS
jgi:hypothetical protein